MVTGRAVEGSLAAMHSNMCFDTEELRVGSSTICAFEKLVRSISRLVASEYFLISSVHAVAVFDGRKDCFEVSQVRVDFFMLESSDVAARGEQIYFSRIPSTRNNTAVYFIEFKPLIFSHGCSILSC